MTDFEDKTKILSSDANNGSEEPAPDLNTAATEDIQPGEDKTKTLSSDAKNSSEEPAPDLNTAATEEIQPASAPLVYKGQPLSLMLSDALKVVQETDPKTVALVGKVLQKGQASENEVVALVLAAADVNLPVRHVVSLGVRHNMPAPLCIEIYSAANSSVPQAEFIARGITTIHKLASGGREWKDCPLETKAETVDEAIDLVKHWREVNEHFGGSPWGVISFAAYTRLYGQLLSTDQVIDFIDEITDEPLSGMELRRKSPLDARIRRALEEMKSTGRARLGMREGDDPEIDVESVVDSLD